MPIELKCSSCHNQLSVPDAAAGKKARCPACNSIQDVPQRSAPATGHEMSEEEIRQPQSESRNPVNPYERAEPIQNPYATMPQQATDWRAYAVSRIRPPAIASLVVAILTLVCSGIMSIVGMVETINNARQQDDIAAFIAFAVFSLVQIVIIIGCQRMYVMKNYVFCLATVILTLVTGVCCMLTLPFGIWALVVLLDQNVRRQFT